MSQYLDFGHIQSDNQETEFLSTNTGVRHSPSCPLQHEIFLQHQAVVHVPTLVLKSPQKFLHLPKAFITHDELLVAGKSGL
jgi:hypothetical protein